MYKVKVIENFTLKDYISIKNVEMNGEKYPVETTENGAKFLVGETFECDKEMLEYLTGGNKLGKNFVEVIEELKEIKGFTLTEKALKEFEKENKSEKKSKKGRKKNGK